MGCGDQGNLGALNYFRANLSAAVRTCSQRPPEFREFVAGRIKVADNCWCSRAAVLVCAWPHCRNRRGFVVATHPTDIHDALTTPTLRAQRAFSMKQFCRRYSIGRTKAYEEIKRRRLHARKIGRRTVILEDDAEAWSQRLPRMKSTHGAGEAMP